MAVEGLSQVVNARVPVAEALRLLQGSDFAGAERVLAAYRARAGDSDPQAIYLLGVARLKLARFAEATEAFALARRLAPLQARPAFGHGEALAALGCDSEAAEAYRAAIHLDPNLADARYELAAVLHRLGELEKAQAALEELLAHAPGHVPARLALGGVLIDAKRPGEAEKILREGLGLAPSGGLKAAFHTNLGLALRRQRKDQEALEQYEQALVLHPDQPGLAVHRAEALQNLGRHDEALEVYETALAADPGDVELHHRINELLYRLDRRDAYLKSYDKAPPSRALLLGKASLLSQEKRGAESFVLYRQLLDRDAGDKPALLGAANALNVMEKPRDALALLEPALARGEDAALLVRAAESALLAGDPQKAESFCRRALALAPHDQLALANLSLAWRMMADAREDELNGYDRHVRLFDLDPPEGFSRMEDFNAELCAVLDRMHPRTREHIDQSLRGGTQTPDHLFHAGHDLVDRLERRIAQVLKDYIGAMQGADDHPLISRRARNFQYAGSWSSRLTNCGFHVNHVHPAGWISSCYYVGVPKVTQDAKNRQGWIKFGEPSADLALPDPIKRAIQPVPGRLVLFPSYMWHGTIPFEDDAVRTTIAFDVIPKN
jgi:tetratricopeptide (TPR) repeat protein